MRNSPPALVESIYEYAEPDRLVIANVYVRFAGARWLDLLKGAKTAFDLRRLLQERLSLYQVDPDALVREWKIITNGDIGQIRSELMEAIGMLRGAIPQQAVMTLTHASSTS
jgi:hypothetical protein